MNSFNTNPPRGGNFCIGKAGLGVGSTASQVSTTTAVVYTIDGIYYSLAVQATKAITAAAQQAASTTCLYLVGVNAAGSFKTFKGKEVLSADLANDVVGLEWPLVDDDYCVIGGFMIVTSSSATFTAGTTLFSAAGITDTFFDMMVPPANIKLS